MASPPNNWLLVDTKILVVDDNDDNRTLFETILNSQGANVAVASDGKAGQEIAMNERFDLIIMDVQMPVCDGYEATVSLRANGCDVPIVAITSNSSEKEQLRLLGGGCNEFKTKPISFDDLVQTAYQWTRTSKAKFPLPHS